MRVAVCNIAIYFCKRFLEKRNVGKEMFKSVMITLKRLNIGIVMYRSFFFCFLLFSLYFCSRIWFRTGNNVFVLVMVRSVLRLYFTFLRICFILSRSRYVSSILLIAVLYSGLRRLIREYMRKLYIELIL